MIEKYPGAILTKPRVIATIIIACGLLVAARSVHGNGNGDDNSKENSIKLERQNSFVDTTPYETIVFKDELGNEHEEYAFRAPMKGKPEQVVDMFCASTKMRIYWGAFREEIKESHRKGIYIRRMARFAKHIFDDIRDADKPFNDTMLSKVDKYFATSTDCVDESIEQEVSSSKKSTSNGQKSPKKKFKALKVKLIGGRKSSSSTSTPPPDDDDGDVSDEVIKETTDGDPTQLEEEIDTSDPMKELEMEGFKDAAKKIKKFVKKWAPKVAVGLYTRYRTMWWMTMSCLFAKFYLWDPALDEFTKLKRNLVMWPEFQLVKLRDISCKPLKLFKRILDVCEILNPLFHFNFGHLSLERISKFKSDTR